MNISVKKAALITIMTGILTFVLLGITIVREIGVKSLSLTFDLY